MKAGKPLPWATVRAAIDGACQGRLLERTEDSGPWPCDYAGAAKVKLKPAKQARRRRLHPHRHRRRPACWSPPLT